jgi:hypothetical protein
MTAHVNKRRLKTPEEMEQAFLRRFWTYVDKAGPDECWLWNISVGGPGYGQIWRVDRMVAAHRTAYELTNGPIPDGMHVLHSCDVRACCNPAHLHIGTHQDNMREMWDRGRVKNLSRGPCPRRKLSPEQVRTIRAQAGAVPKLVQARRHGVAHYTIWLLLNGDTYKDVV